MFYTIKHQGNANQNHSNSKIAPPHLSEGLLAKRQEKTDVSKDAKKIKKEPFCTTAKKINWCSHCGNQYEGSSKRELPYDPVIPLLGIFQRK